MTNQPNPSPSDADEQAKLETYLREQIARERKAQEEGRFAELYHSLSEGGRAVVRRLLDRKTRGRQEK